MQNNNNKRAKSMQMDYSFDESGYASFHGATQVLHNSTLLLDSSDNNENSQNVQNTTQQQQNWHHSLLTAATAYSKLSEILPTSPIHSVGVGGTSAASSLNYSTSLNIIENYTPPHEERSATKRQKEHYKPHQHNHQNAASLKKYKKNLFPEEPSVERIPSYIGVERFDIIGNLPVVPLERILNILSVQTLATMKQVSRSWQQIVYKHKDATQRIHYYQLKQYKTKENAAVTSQINLVKSHNIPRNTVVPLHNSNSAYGIATTAAAATATANTWPGFAFAPQQQHQQQQKTAIFQNFDQNERRVRCPLCGKSSKVMSDNNNADKSLICLSSTLPALPTPTNHPMLNRFASLDRMPIAANCNSSQELHNSYAECTGAVCKFRFCLDCTCAYHPGQKCPVTELGTPSKILLTPSESTTPPKRIHKTEAKLKRKKSLKRLCF